MRMFVCRGLRFLVVCSLLALLTTPALAQNGRPTLIPEVMAQRYGLTRAWATRLGLDAARARVHEITLHDGTLISVTDDSSVQAIDAETGRTLWTTSVGRRSYPNTQVGASKSYVALCNGSTLYVLSRADGSLLFTRKVQGTPSAAPAVSEDRIFIPTFAGAIESYEINLEEPKLTPTTYRSKGMIEEPPVLAGDYLIWATHSGAIYSATKKDLTANYRFMSRGTITAGLGYWPPLVYAASSDGYIYAIDERNGKRRWQFSTNYPAREAPVALDGDVYAISETSGMFCLSADRGAERWFTSGVAKFLAASAHRLYTADETGRIMILDRRSGAHLAVMYTELLPTKVVNIQTDRVYLATDTGLLQCLREIDQVKPLIHVVPADVGTPAAPARRPAAAADAPAMDEEPAAEPAADDPFGADSQP